MPKPQFNQKLNSRLRRLIHFRPHGIRWRSFKNLTKALGFETYIKRLSLINRAGFTSSVALFIISLLIIFPIYYKTQLAEAAGSLSDTTLSITSDNLVAGVDLLVTSDSGTFATSNPISFTVITTNSSGYTLSLKSKSGSTDLTNTSVDGTGASVSSTFVSITSTSGISADIFSDSSNTAYDNHWGIRPSYYESVANSDGLYYPSPDSDGVILNTTDKANTSGTVDIYTIAIGARATYAQPAGTYSNNYILSAVGNYPRQATCTKQYRLQNADGSFPTTYTLDTTEELDIGTTCTYTKSVSDYKHGGASAANGASGTISDNVTEDGVTLSLDFYRNTYTLTISAGSNTSNPTANGTSATSYTARWGETVAVGVTKATNTTCLTYATPTWTQSGTTGTFSGTSGASVNFTMGKGTATVTATSSSSRNTYTITYNNNGGSGTMSNTIGSCGAATTLRANTFTRSGYNFLGWSTSSSATTATYTDGQSMTLSQTTTLPLYAVWKACVTSVSGTMQDFYPCNSVANGTSGSLTDSRDNQVYTVKKINDQWWMTRNLAIGCNGSGSSYGSSVKSVQLTSADSNVSATHSTPTDLLSGASSSTRTADYSAGRMQCNDTYGAWYNYYAATASTISGSSNSIDATEDICPLNWHLPTAPNTTSGTDFNKLVSNTTSGWQDPTDSLKAFGAVAGGNYFNGLLLYNGYGYWWSTTAGNTTYRYYLGYNSSTGQFNGTTSSSRYIGVYIRCVHD